MAGRGSKPGERRGGRQKGTLNRINVSARLRVVQEADPIGRLIAAAKTGKLKVGTQELDLDVDQQLGVIRELRKIAVPDAKSLPVQLALPPIQTAADVLTAIGAVIGEMAKGVLAPDESLIIANVLEQKRKAIETVDLEARVAALEPKGAK